MPRFASTPLAIKSNDYSLVIERDLDSRESMIDNFIELIVFTPRGSFNADPDFGFEYWNYEYANVRYIQFNNGDKDAWCTTLYDEATRQECEESVKRNIEEYLPQLKSPKVELSLNPVEKTAPKPHQIYSKYSMEIVITGKIEDGLGTKDYKKTCSFLIEPTVKKAR